MSPSAPPQDDLPWRHDEFISLCTAFAVAGVLVLASWYGASGTMSWTTAMGWVVLGMVGVVIAGAGSARWILSGTRAARIRERELASRLESMLDGATEEADASSSVSDSVKRVSGPRMTLYHRPDCPLVAAKSVSAKTMTQHLRAGRSPCGVCAA